MIALGPNRHMPGVAGAGRSVIGAAVAERAILERILNVGVGTGKLNGRRGCAAMARSRPKSRHDNAKFQ